MKAVIIGGSAAGIQAAEELRGLEPQAEITVISDEPHYPYSRCLISRHVEGKLAPEGLRFRTGRFFEQHGINGWLGSRVERINSEGKTVHLADGRQAPYDRLLIATGARPFVPGIPGLKQGNVFTFHSMADAEAIVSAAQDARQVVVLGAGFAGLEAAYALARRGKQVTVVERMGQILPNQLDWTGSAIIQSDLERSGVRILLDNSVAAVEGSDAVSSVALTDRSSLVADMVIVATGTRPNVELAQQAGIATQRGIIVDAYLQTSAPDIWAAGDVIEIDDISTGRRLCSATWVNAILQGRFAAWNMAGRRRLYTDAVGIQNAVQFHHVPAISFGQTLVGADSAEDFEVMTLRQGQVYKKLVLQDDILRGMIFVGDIAKAGFYAALIRHRVDLSAVKQRLLDDDFSYAAVMDLNSFGQKNPYANTDPAWESDAFWAQRAQAAGIIR
jgi:NAD(P)H-nitrite reductase large subunit